MNGRAPSGPLPVALVLVLVTAIVTAAFTQPSAQALPAGAPQADVVVLGSEPEAIVAAVAAAESGAKTFLISADPRLGGLFVLGSLNVLDVRTRPMSYQAGAFERWWRSVGRRNAFDPGLAERAFAAMLAEAGVNVVLNVLDVAVSHEDGRVTGAVWRDGAVAAGQVIDGDADLRHAASAGAQASLGWEWFGLEARMADTLVFRIDGVDWTALRTAARNRGRDWATVDDAVAWGAFGGVPASYQPVDPTTRLRGLNLGRDASGGVWVNALLLYGVDPFDPASRADGRARGEAEARRVVSWLAPRLPGFGQARFGAAAESLYVRETRHLLAECVLDASHLLDNVTSRFDVAAGGYPLDLQSLTPYDSGFVFGTPDLYGVPLCVSVPRDGPDGLWTVGRSVGYDPVAHSSTRVVPLGMAVAEGVGVAAALAAGRDGTPARLVSSEPFLAEVRTRLRQRGAFLAPLEPRDPVGPFNHPHHQSYRRMLSRGLALGGYDNAPDLDGAVPARSHLYLAAEVAKRFAGRNDVAQILVGRYAADDGPAEASRVARVQRDAACLLGLPCPDEATPEALARWGLWPDGVARSGALRRGEVYALGAVLSHAPAGER